MQIARTRPLFRSKRARLASRHADCCTRQETNDDPTTLVVRYVIQYLNIFNKLLILNYYIQFQLVPGIIIEARGDTMGGGHFTKSWLTSSGE